MCIRPAHTPFTLVQVPIYVREASIQPVSALGHSHTQAATDQPLDLNQENNPSRYQLS